MPEIKTKHEDIIRKEKLDEALKHLSLLQKFGKPIVYEWRKEPKEGEDKGDLQREEIVIHYPMIRTLVCLLFLFGKRISEVLVLKRGDFYIRRGYLYVRFMISKKPTRTALAMPIVKIKRVSIKNQREYVQPILDYIATLNDGNLPLFPGSSRPHTLIVKRKDKKTGKIIKEYKYEVKREGVMSRVQAYKILKALDEEFYPHWFRHSLATALAEEGFTAHELKDWFDWSRYDTASSYVEGMPSMTARISARKIT